MATESSDGGGGSSGLVPNQLAILVPTFNPAVDSVDTWTQKVELLLAAWPESKLQELATRLVLGCQGTAFQKLQLHRSEVLKNDKKAIQRIVELVGGTWGQVPLEQKFEIAERALYRTQQKGDETADSYLARMDVTWTEMLAKQFSLPELQAYVTLRNSRLGSEDKKRVIVESGNKLEMKKVTAAIRMLGSNFFQEMTGQKRDKALKVYDHLTLAAEEDEDQDLDAYVGVDEGLDEDTLEALAAENDDDAAMVLQFESAVSDLVQNDGELSALFSTYQDARRRLSERVRVRGFWPVSKGFGKKGNYKGKNTMKGKGSSLAQRIANTHCRLCNQKGHWKAECPNRPGNSNATASTVSVPTSFAIVDPVLGTVEDVPVFDHPTLSASSLHEGAATGAKCNQNSNDVLENAESWRRPVNPFSNHLAESIAMSSLVQKMKAHVQRTAQQEAAEETQQFSQMSLAEMGQMQINFGEKYRGQSFEKAFSDAKWTEWFVSTYGQSKKPVHMQYLTFVERTLDNEIQQDRKIKVSEPKCSKSSGLVSPKNVPIATPVSLTEWDALSEEEITPGPGPAGATPQYAKGPVEHATPHERPRECSARDDLPPQGLAGENRELSASGLDESHSMLASEWASNHILRQHEIDVDFEFHVEQQHPQSFMQEYHKWMNIFQKEIQAVRSLNWESCRRPRLDLLEVMCSPQSEMVKQAQLLGARAQRFGLAEGDLRQATSRQKLFMTILLHRPKNLWYSTLQNVVLGAFGMS
eukprot:s529_g6.t1